MTLIATSLLVVQWLVHHCIISKWLVEGHGFKSHLRLNIFSISLACDNCSVHLPYLMTKLHIYHLYLKMVQHLDVPIYLTCFLFSWTTPSLSPSPLCEVLDLTLISTEDDAPQIQQLPLVDPGWRETGTVCNAEISCKKKKLSHHFTEYTFTGSFQCCSHTYDQFSKNFGWETWGVWLFKTNVKNVVSLES